jgi:hypothetical protein
MLTKFRVTVKKYGIAEQFSFPKSLDPVERLNDSKKIIREDVWDAKDVDMEMHAGDFPIITVREISKRVSLVRVITLAIQVEGIVAVHDLQT